MGISKRMASAMQPAPSKREEAVMFDVEKWTDELRELVAMGQEDLPPSYKTTALKMIAVGEIKKNLENKESELTGHPAQRVWEEMRGMALNMSSMKIVEKVLAHVIGNYKNMGRQPL